MAFYQKQTEKNITLLFASLSIISLLAWLMNTYAPTAWTIPAFFLLLFCAISLLMLFFSNNLRKSALVASALCGILLLRLIGLREPFYSILFIACLLSLELYINKR